MTLHPLQGNGAHNVGAASTYHLVGRLLYGQGHFSCRHNLSSHPSCIYEYNDIVAGGLARLLGGDGKGCTLAGPQFVPPPHCRTPCVVYSLVGGEAAQKDISLHLITQITRSFPLQITADAGGGYLTPSIAFQQAGTLPTPAQDRTWLRDPRRTDVLDYHVVPPLFPTTLATPQDRMNCPPGRPAPPMDQSLSVWCRCGVRGTFHCTEVDQPMVECIGCGDWSHIACQNESTLGSSDEFECDICSGRPLRSMADTVKMPTLSLSDHIYTPPPPLPPPPPPPSPSHGRSASNHISLSLAPSKRTPTNKGLRFVHCTVECKHGRNDMHYRAGKGALAHHGKFWYPVRLVQLQDGPVRAWKVVWWRDCAFLDAPPDPAVPVPESRLVDELWGDQASRRSIRVSKFVPGLDGTESHKLDSWFA